MTEFFTNTVWVRQIAYILAGGLLGLLTERFLIGAFHRLAMRTKSTWDDLLVEAVRGMPLIWFTTAGIWLAVEGSVSPAIRDTLRVGMVFVVFATTTLVLIRLVTGGVSRYAVRQAEGLPSPTLVKNVITVLITMTGIALLLQNLDVAITPLITAMGIGGLAVALALQDTLSNFFAGVSIIMSGQVRRRDYIQLSSGEEGIVTDVKGRNTTIRTFPHHNLVVIPNAVLAASIVTNFSLPERNLWINIPVGVSYDSDLEAVELIAIDVAKQALESVEGSPSSLTPLVRYQEFGDSSINFDVVLPARQFTDQFLIRHEFIKRLHARFNQEGIEIPFPIRTIHMRTTPDAPQD